MFHPIEVVQYLPFDCEEKCFKFELLPCLTFCWVGYMFLSQMVAYFGRITHNSQPSCQGQHDI